MFCPNCGTNVDEKSLFCPECGKKLDSSGVPGQTPLKMAEQEHQREKASLQDGGNQTGQHQQRQQYQQYQQEPPRPSRKKPAPKKKKSNAFSVVLSVTAVLLVAVLISVVIFGMIRKKSDDGTTTSSGGAGAAIVNNDSPESGEIREGEEPTEEPTEVPAEAPTEAPTATPSPVPTATPTPTPAPTWAGKTTRDQQQSLLTTGNKLDQSYMNNILNSNAATRAVYVLDVNNMEEYGVENSDTPLPASALIGVPILFTIAEDIENGLITQNTSVTFSYTFEGGRGNLKSSQHGQSFPILQLLSAALLYSDNNALNSLIDYLGLDHINYVCRNAGYTSVDMQRKLMASSSYLENYISAKDAVMMINAIYQNNYSVISRSFLESNFYIAAGDTSNTGMYAAGHRYQTFLNLNGVTDTRYNEIGVFVQGDKVVIACMLTANGNSERSVYMVNDLTSYIVTALMG